MIPETLIRPDLDLAGIDGNAFAVIGAVRRALRDAGNTPADVSAVVDEMTSGDYSHLIAVAVEVVA